jgi:glycosyltransferase involved in cell wall biosynthesis
VSAPPADAPIRVAFVLAELTLGGAEMMLWKLVSRLDGRRFQPLVIALSSRVDGMVELFERTGIPYRLLGMRSRADIGVLRRLVTVLREFQPHIVQGWMYYGNLVAALASPCLPRRPAVLWNIRGTLNLAQEKRLAIMVIRLGATLSFIPRKIINNSLESAVEHEQRLGYASSKRVILPNGFDTDVFRPSDESRVRVRSALGLGGDAVVIGLIGRYHPMKDHDTFLRAAALVSLQFPDAHFALAGENVDPENAALHNLIATLRLAKRVHLLGIRNDMPALTAALDVAVSSSSGGEGFPNVVGEAMSCGVPCVATDVGASASVIGDTGKCVPARDPAALARAIVELLAAGGEARQELGRRARDRVIHQFALSSVAARYEDLYVQVHAQSAERRQA